MKTIKKYMGNLEVSINIVYNRLKWKEKIYNPDFNYWKWEGDNDDDWIYTYPLYKYVSCNILMYFEINKIHEHPSSRVLFPMKWSHVAKPLVS